jgi:glucose-specific phosphotransferase system IIA component
MLEGAHQTNTLRKGHRMPIVPLYGDHPVVPPCALTDIELAPGVAAAPVTGLAMPLSFMRDPVISEGVLGPGACIVPRAECVFAPVTGVVSVRAESDAHAVGMTSDDGVEVFIHVGTNTCNLAGYGFSYLVEKGVHVEAGTPLLLFDREILEAEGYDDTVAVIFSNAAVVDVLAAGLVDAGAPFAQVKL